MRIIHQGPGRLAPTHRPNIRKQSDLVATLQTERLGIRRESIYAVSVHAGAIEM